MVIKITQWYFNVLKALLCIVGPLYLLVNSFHNQNSNLHLEVALSRLVTIPLNTNSSVKVLKECLLFVLKIVLLYHYFLCRGNRF